MKISFIIFVFLVLAGFNNSVNSIDKNLSVINSSDFKLGNEVLLTEKIDMLKDKRVAIITNQTGITSNGNHIIDELKGKVNIVKVFSPEHGFRGDDNTGNYIDAQSGINVVSLYGTKKKPSAEDLTDVDVLIYDIQDVGARIYTYVNTLYHCMEAALKPNKEFIVLDRPIMIDGDYVDGFMLKGNAHSSVGLLDIPLGYGLTCGELQIF